MNPYDPPRPNSNTEIAVFHQMRRILGRDANQECGNCAHFENNNCAMLIENMRRGVSICSTAHVRADLWCVEWKDRG